VSPRVKGGKSFLEQYRNDDWKNHVKKTDKNYIKDLIFRNDNFELFVVSWMPRKGSTIHDHSQNGCLFKILCGELVEERYSFTELKLQSSLLYKKDDIGYIENEKGLHKMLNKTNEIVISLHLYSPPNYLIKSYDNGGKS